MFNQVLIKACRFLLKLLSSSLQLLNCFPEPLLFGLDIKVDLFSKPPIPGLFDFPAQTAAVSGA